MKNRSKESIVNEFTDRLHKASPFQCDDIIEELIKTLEENVYNNTKETNKDDRNLHVQGIPIRNSNRTRW